MLTRLALAAVLMLLPALLAETAHCQFMYLDSNGDGISSEADRLDSLSVPTVVDVYLYTSQIEDGSPAHCSTADGDLTINSYVFCLVASGGSVAFSTFLNQRPEMSISFGEVNAGNGLYKNGAGGGTSNPAGLYRLATLTITAVSGAPSIGITDVILGSSDFTSFGTQCSGLNGDNTYTLGVDWYDSAGLGAPGSLNSPPLISAPATAQASEGMPVSLAAIAVDPDAGQAVSISIVHPPFLARDGVTPSATALLTGTPGFNDAGSYTLTWTATDDAVPPVASSVTTILSVQNTDRPPVPIVPAQAAGSASDPITFTVAASDPDGDSVPSLVTSNMPPGATLTNNPGETVATFNWVPDVAMSGTVEVGFTASNAGGSGQATTTILVTPPTGPRRPYVDPELRRLQPGLLSSERILSRTEDGQAFANLFIVGDASSEMLEGIGVKVNSRLGRVMTARCPIGALPGLFDTGNLDAVIAPGSCHLLLDSSIVDVNVAGIRTVESPLPRVGRTGVGVIVGVVDTGIDVANPDFKRINGTSRILSYWNQTHGDNPPQGFSYGTEWSSSQISSGSVDVWGGDSIGHGTHVAGIAAGNSDASTCVTGSGRYPYLGVAPESHLCVVKAIAKGAGRPRSEALESQIADGVKYVFQVAEAVLRPAVVNLSLGGHFGPHNGRSNLDGWMNRLAGPGKVIVAAAGNDGNSGVHARIQAHPGGPAAATLVVGEYSPGTSSGKFIHISGWYNAADVIAISVVTPQGVVVGPTPLNNSADTVTPDGRVTICHAPLCEVPIWYTSWLPDVPFLIELTDTAIPGETAHPIAAGTWTIQAHATLIGATGRVDTYVRGADLGGDNTPPIGFVVGADPSRTITAPASADSTIAVGAYETRKCWKNPNGVVLCKSFADSIGSIERFSSLGPRRDGAVKPDLCAPGGMVVSSRSGVAFLGDTVQVVVGGDYAVQAGTSMAAPHVTGAVALMLGRGTPGNPDSLWHAATPSRVKERIQASARRDSLTGFVTNNTWGAGKLDVRAALAPVMGVRFTEPKKGAVFNTHWGQAGIMGDSATANATFDLVVIELALDGCNYTERVAELSNVSAYKRSYSFLYFAPESYRTAKAKLRATAYAGPNRVQAFSDSLFSFAFGPPPPTAVAHEDAPRRFTLHPNAPNPFNPVTTIRFETVVKSQVTVRVFGIDGRLVRTIIDQALPPGAYSVLWDGSNDRAEQVGSGVYLCEVTSAGDRLRRKITLIK